VRKKKKRKSRWVTVPAQFWDVKVAEAIRDQHRKSHIDKELTVKKSLFVSTTEKVHYVRKGREVGKEISRIWDAVRPEKGGTSGQLFLVTVGETRPRKAVKKKKRFSKRREGQIIRGSIRGRFVSFK
jgi:hypothetical protein